jgi:hypothetical protein
VDSTKNNSKIQQLIWIMACGHQLRVGAHHCGPSVEEECLQAAEAVVTWLVGVRASSPRGDEYSPEAQAWDFLLRKFISIAMMTS